MLSEHFTETELGVALVGDVNKTANAKALCVSILEPIRAQFGALRIHCGYRPSEHNAQVGGKLKSEHLFNGGQAAADFDVVGRVDLQTVFDWIRLKSSLPFDQVILEFEKMNGDDPTGEPACVHVAFDRLNQPRRQAMVGSVGNCEHYVHVAVK